MRTLKEFEIMLFERRRGRGGGALWKAFYIQFLKIEILMILIKKKKKIEILMMFGGR